MPRSPIFPRHLLIAATALAALCAPEARAVCMWADMAAEGPALQP